MNTDRSIAQLRRLVAAALFGLGICVFQVATPRGALAQETGSWNDATKPADDLEQQGAGFEVTGYLGVLTPLSTLANQEDTLKAEFTTSVSYALGLDYWFSGGFGIGVFGGYTQPEMTIFLIEEAGAFPAELSLGNVDYWYGVLTAMYRPNLGGNKAILRPYFLLGGGVKSLGSGELDLGDGETFSVESSTKPVLAIGAGAHLIISKSWFLRLDVRDLISQFDSEPFQDAKLQNDLFTSIGFGYAFH
jgi:outer membrane beta-barrel protein